MDTALKLVLLLPLAGVLFGLLLGRRLGEKAMGWIASLLVGGAFLSALVAVLGLVSAGLEPGDGVRVLLFSWIEAGPVAIDAALRLDPLSAAMILTVTGVGFLIHVYSIGYMHGDPGFGRYFTYLNLFTFAMLLLVLADNLVLLFVGWEGVGLCSYLLIGFWFQRDSAAEAGQKAFIVNRIGDAAFLVALLLLFFLFGTLEIGQIIARAPQVLVAGSFTTVLIPLLLFAGATGKSAQIPLHVWLPDAMEGPTPVSALIHAATMVTAGVYLVARTSPLFELAPITLTVVAIVGVLTALIAGLIAISQYDIKKVLAYSTISQLGFMFLALGVGAYVVAIFHLVMHAFFKALLFMGAGSVIHALDGRQDMREMGGLRSQLPITHLTMMMGALALSGIPFAAGFFSKDEILYEAWAGPYGHPLLWVAGALAALMTAFYAFRLIYLTFHGMRRLDESVHPHESPPVMTVPLIILAVLSAIGGFSGMPSVLGGSARFQAWVGQALPGGAHHGSATLSLVLMAASVALAVTGLLLARHWYNRPDPFPEAPAAPLGPLWSAMRQKFYFDEFYFLMVVSPLYRTSKWCYRALDVVVIDGFVRGTATLCLRLAGVISRLQWGHTGGYALAVAVGALLLLTVVLRWAL